MAKSQYQYEFVYINATGRSGDKQKLLHYSTIVHSQINRRFNNTGINDDHRLLGNMPAIFLRQ